MFLHSQLAAYLEKRTTEHQNGRLFAAAIDEQKQVVHGRDEEGAGHQVHEGHNDERALEQQPVAFKVEDLAGYDSYTFRIRSDSF